MKKNYLLIHFLLCTVIICCGQKQNGNGSNKGNLPVALGTIFQPTKDTEGIVPNTNPIMQKSILNDYIMQMEWHFEIRFTDAERTTYEKIIVDMWNKSEKLRGNVDFWVKNIQEVRAKDWFNIFMAHSSRSNSDIMDCGMETLLTNWNPSSLRGIIKKGFNENDTECTFLWNKITAYEAPIVEGKVFVSRFSQRYVDAAAEWLAYKINVVANKEFIVLDETKREQMKDMILAAWKKEQNEKKSEFDYGNIQAMLLQATTYWNTLRLTKKYSLDSYITNYNKLSTVADWAKEVVFYCPSVKPYAEARIKEYSDYAAHMSEAEWKIEFQRLNMQIDMSKQVFQQMKNDQVRSHVLMLNIIEGGDRWEVKETKIY